MSVSARWALCVPCVFVCVSVCHIKANYQQKNMSSILDFSKLDLLWHETHKEEFDGVQGVIGQNLKDGVLAK